MIRIFLAVIILIAHFQVSYAADSGCETKCTFNEEHLTSKNIGSWPKSCSKVCSPKFYIDDKSNLTQQQLTNAFQNLKTLIGGIDIYNTKLTNMKFLASLQKIDAGEGFAVWLQDNSQMVEIGMTNLTEMIGGWFTAYDNFKMTKLNMPKLKSFKCKGTGCEGYIYVRENHPKNFCMSSNELQAFMNSKSNEVQAEGKVCTPAKFTAKICKAPAAACVELYGNLNIGANFAVKKVKALKFLYGSLIVKNTNITNFKFLGNLTQIAQIEGGKVGIDVQGNKKLTSAAFPKLQRVLVNPWTYVNNDYEYFDSMIFKNNTTTF